MALSQRENYLRNASFDVPESMPVQIHISNASWDQWRGEMEDVVARHPRIWPGFEKGKRDWDHFDFGPGHTRGVPFKDAWGCVWETSVNGIEGVVTQSPLADWNNWDTWAPPDPLRTADRGPVDWDAIRRDMQARRAAGELCEGGLPHGFLFMRLSYLRGFENILMDMTIEDPLVWKLIDLLDAHNRVIIEQYLDMDVDVIGIPEDLGAQNTPILSPFLFRKFIKPAYEKLLKPCRDKGCHVLMHSDGYILDLIDDLMLAGVTIINPQDLVNGIDNLAREFKGRVCIRLDVDRQTVVPFGSPNDIHDLVEEEVRKLGSPRGGLELIAGIYPPTSPQNVDALAAAFEEFQTYWFDGRGDARFTQE